ncbi:hypothetical protein B0H16DRAFT_1749630 [Mycena metata]|uniref:Uncharacterized protein n=1 Tax=Mycena metata TaxID=1033252 RepID=A0AAD7DUD4_9AGAR|nr:hypothetical protein B0H16DRAFT_1749630 [Mycena metata]
MHAPSNAARPPLPPSPRRPSWHHPIAPPLGLPNLQLLLFTRLVAGPVLLLSTLVLFRRHRKVVHAAAYKYPNGETIELGLLARIPHHSYFLWELTRRHHILRALQDDIDATRALSRYQDPQAAFIKAALPLSVRRRAPLYPHPTTSKFVRAEDGVRTRSHPARTIDSTQAWLPSYTRDRDVPPQRWLPSRRRVQGGLMDGGEASEAEACLARMASHTTPFGTGSRLRVYGGVNLRRACSSLCCRPGIASGEYGGGSRWAPRIAVGGAGAGSTVAAPAPQRARLARARARTPPADARCVQVVSTPAPGHARSSSVPALPYRMLYAVVAMDTVAIYDTQARPVCLLTKLHYDDFWRVPDGLVRDGYSTLVTVDEIPHASHAADSADCGPAFSGDFGRVELA